MSSSLNTRIARDAIAKAIENLTEAQNALLQDEEGTWANSVTRALALIIKRLAGLSERLAYRGFATETANRILGKYE